MKNKLLLVCLVLTLALPSVLKAGRIYVNINSEGTAEDGKTWQTAFKTLQKGVNASVAEDEIWVAAGTYAATDSLTPFLIKRNVNLYGGFAGNESSVLVRDIQANKTIISGFGADNKMARRIFYINISNTTNLFDGFQIQDGTNGIDFNWDWPIVTTPIENCTLRVINCTFTKNRYALTGGAKNARLDIENCDFYNNESQSISISGVEENYTAVANVLNSKFHDHCGTANFNRVISTVVNCEFYNNKRIQDNYFTLVQYSQGKHKLQHSNFKGNEGGISNGGDNSNLVIDDCMFDANGGQMISYGGSTGKVINCTFTNNYSSNNGDVVNTGGSTVDFENCQVKNNLTRWGYVNGKIKFTNCVFNDNAGSYGGVLYSGGANITIDNCSFERNTGESGAGALTLGGSSFVITNSVFNANKVTLRKFKGAGAVSAEGSHSDKVYIVRNCTFDGNQGVMQRNSGGALSITYAEVTLIENCKFYNNKGFSGGGIYLEGGNPTIANCEVSNNTVVQSGGGIYAYSSSKLNIFNTKIVGNICLTADSVTSLGAGACIVYSYSGAFSNSIICNNEIKGDAASNQGGGIYGYAQWPIINCTVAGNKAPIGAGIASLGCPIYNSVIWGNFGSSQITSSSEVSYSVFSGKLTSSVQIQNIELDPKFVDLSNCDLRLKCESPLINKGGNKYVVDIPDFDGTPRIIGDSVDIGAYEFPQDPKIARLIPNVQFDIPSEGCKEEILKLVNKTTPLERTKFEWSFGDGTKSQSVQTTHAYKEAGQYTVTLKATNSCEMSTSLNKEVRIRPTLSPKISYSTVVCPNTTSEFSTDSKCSNLAWTVVGGSIIAGQNTTKIKVLWGDGSLGNGKVVLDATSCGVDACETALAVEVPIVPTTFSIVGANKVCPGSYNKYELSLKGSSPGTIYTWKVEGGNIINGAASGYGLTSVNVNWNDTEGDAKITLITYNELLKCGDTSFLPIKIKPKFQVQGSAIVCSGVSTTYTAQPSGSFEYKVEGGNTINSATGLVDWKAPVGLYYVSAQPTIASNFCNANDSLQVEIVAKPVIDTIFGDLEVDTNKTAAYSAVVIPSSSSVYFSAKGGIVQSSQSNYANILWGKNEPFQLFTQLQANGINCPISYDTINIKKKFVFVVEGKENVCISDKETYTATQDLTTPVDYKWATNAGEALPNGNKYTITFTQSGYQYIELTATRDGKQYNVQKGVIVNAELTNLKVSGPTTIDPEGIGTYNYTIENPANINVVYEAIGATSHSRIGDVITVKWGGTEPFKLKVTGVVAGKTCTGVPIVLDVKKAELLSPTINSSASACQNAEVTYFYTTDDKTENLTWNISGGGTIIERSGNSIKVQWGDKVGTYNVGVSYNRYGARTASLAVQVNPLPLPTINQAVICGANPTPLSTSSTYTSYNWMLDPSNTTFSTATSPNVTEEGMYKVQVTDSKGCKGSTFRYIKQIPIPQAQLFTDQSTGYCIAENAPFSTDIKISTLVGDGYSYKWFKNEGLIPSATSFSYQFSQQLAISSSDVYKVVAMREGCESSPKSITFSVIKCVPDTSDPDTSKGCKDPVVSFNASACQPFTFTNTTSFNDGFTWEFGDGSTSSAKNPNQKSYAAPGAYTVTLRRGCQSTSRRVEVPAVAIFKLESPSCTGQETKLKNYSVHVPTSNIDSWTWNYGDNTSSSGSGSAAKDGLHEYGVSGTYKPVLTVNAKNSNGQSCAIASENSIFVYAAPVANFTVTSPKCFNSVFLFSDKTDFKASAAMFAWDFGGSQTASVPNPSQEFSTPGTRTVKLTVKDVLGCTSQKSQDIKVNPKVEIGSITVTGNTFLCNGATVKLSSPFAEKYNWKRDGQVIGLATREITVSKGGLYTVDYTSDTCTVTSKGVAITEYNVGSQLSGTLKACIGDPFQLYSNLLQAKYQFNWKFNDVAFANSSSTYNVAKTTPALAGKYTLSVTDLQNGCSVTLPAVEVTVATKPTAPSITADKNKICHGGDVTLKSNDSFTGKALKWYKDGTALAGTTSELKIVGAIEKDAGNYSLQIIDIASSCSATSSAVAVSIEPKLNATLSAPTSSCEGDVVNVSSGLAASAFNFKWYKGTVDQNVNFNRLSFSKIKKSDEGEYYYVATTNNTNGQLEGCSVTSAKIQLQVKAAPTEPSITGPSEFCTGETVKLIGSATENFKWSNGSTTSSIDVTLGATYTLTVTNPTTGCSIAKSKQVTQNPLPNYAFFPPGVYERCGSDKIVFKGLSSYPYYQWYVDGKKAGNPNQDIYPTKSGKYSLEVRTSKGCTSYSDTLRITSLDCPCLVKNVKDTGAFSLREAINCSNLKVGKDIIKFEIPAPGPYVIAPKSALPLITDSVVIDGFSQSGLGTFAIVLDGQSYPKNALTVDVNVSNSKFTGLTFTNYDNVLALKSVVKNTSIVDNKFIDIKGDVIELNASCDNTLVKGNSFSTAGTAVNFLAESKGSLIESNTIEKAKIGIGLYNKSNNNRISSNNISNLAENGILMYNAGPNNLVDKNKIYGSTQNGVLLNLKSNQNKLDSNFIYANKANGILIQNGSSGNNLNHNIIGSIDGATDNGNNGFGVLMQEGANSNVLANNTIVYNDSANVGITSNSVFNMLDKNVVIYSGKKGIQLAKGGNELIKAPVIMRTAVGLVSDDSLDLLGTSTKDGAIQVFFSDGNKEHALAYMSNGTAIGGNWKAKIPKRLIEEAKDYFFVATTTDATKNTSEFSNVYKLKIYDGNCIVKNVQDKGEGSLREAVDCANNSPKNPKIIFNIPGAGPHRIHLSTGGLYAQNVFGQKIVIDGASQAAFNNLDPQTQYAVVNGAPSLNNYSDRFGLVFTELSGLYFDSLKVQASTNSTISNSDFNNAASIYFGNGGVSVVSNSKFQNCDPCVSLATGTSGSNEIGTNVHVLNNTFMDYLKGVTSYQNSTAIVKGNTFLGRKDNTAFSDVTYGPGGFLTLERNVFYAKSFSFHADNKLTILNNTFGIDVNGLPLPYKIEGVHIPYATKQLIIEGNTFGNTTSDALRLNFADSVVIVRNNFGYNPSNKTNLPIGGHAIFLQLKSDRKVVRIEENEISNFSKDGIRDEVLSVSGDIVQRNVIGSNSSMIGETGIFLNYGPNAKVESNTITHVQTGVHLGTVKQSSVAGNTIDSCTKVGAFITNSSQHNVVRSNTLTANNIGLKVASGSSDDTLAENVIAHSYHAGIWLTSGSSSNIVSKNRLSDNHGFGIKVDTGANTNTIIYNTISANDSVRSTAIGLDRVSGVIVKENTIVGYQFAGVSVEGGNVKVSRTLIDHSSKAISLNLTKPSPGNSAKAKPSLSAIVRKAGKLYLQLKSEVGDSVEVFLSTMKRHTLKSYIGTYYTAAATEAQFALPDSLTTITDTLVLRATAASSKGTSEVSDSLWACPACKCLVTTTENAGNNSLRDAINKANQGACGVIAFKLSEGLAADTIKITTALPDIYNSVFIDGTSESGFVAGQPPVVWIADNTRKIAQGLLLSSDGSQVKAIGVAGFDRGVYITGPNNKINNTEIGASATTYLTISGNGNKIESSLLGAKGNYSGAGVSIAGNNNALLKTIVTNTMAENLVVNTGGGNTFLEGALSNSGRASFTNRVGVKLLGDANDKMPIPKIENHSGELILTGIAAPNARVQVYKGNGVKEQAISYLGEVIAKADGSWSFPTSDYQKDKPNAYIATATNAAGSTSQLSNVYRIGEFFEVCPVTNTDDSGEGSFRAALDCANNSDLKAMVDFQFPDNNPKEIKITTSPKLMLTNKLGTLIDATNENITISSAAVVANNLQVQAPFNTFKGLNLVSLGIELTDASRNIVKNVQFRGRGVLISGNSDNNVVDSNLFAYATLALGVGGAGNCACGAGNTFSNNKLGVAADGSSAPISTFAISVLSKEGNNTISGNQVGNIQSTGFASVGILSIQPNGVITRNLLGQSREGQVQTIKGTGILAIGTGTSVTHNIIYNADTAISIMDVGSFWIPLTASVPDLGSNNISVVSDTIHNGNGTGIVVTKAQNVLLSRNIVVEPGAGKGILLAKKGNNDYPAPTIKKYTVYENALHVVGTANAGDVIELFRSTSQGQRSLKYFATLSTNGDNYWNIDIPLDSLNMDGPNYFVATARNSNNNTSEFSKLFNALLKICLVTKTEDTGDNTLRDAVEKANKGECNLIQFKITPSQDLLHQIALATELPEIVKDNIIVDGTSQPGYLPARTPLVIVASQNTPLAKGISVVSSANFSMHGLGFSNFGQAIKLSKAPDGHIRKNTIKKVVTAIAIEKNEKDDTWVDENTIDGSGDEEEVTNGIVSNASFVKIRNNSLKSIKEVGIRVSGDSSTVWYNRIESSVLTNTFLSQKGAIVAKDASRISVFANTLLSNGQGIVLENVKLSTLANNTIDSLKGASGQYGSVGIYLGGASLSNNVAANVIKDSTTIGISLDGGLENRIGDNKVTRAGVAVQLANSKRNEVVANTISHGGKGILQEKSSREDRFERNNISHNTSYGLHVKGNKNGIHSNVLGSTDPTPIANNAIGLLIESDSNTVGSRRNINNILNNRFGGIMVQSGANNRLVYNVLQHNDTSEAVPFAKAISLNDKKGNNGKDVPVIDSYERNKIDSTFRIFGTSTPDDSVHLYLSYGFEQDALVFLAVAKTDASGKWETEVSWKVFPKTRTTYVVATATDEKNNTSELSNMIPIGYCYITQRRDNGNNRYPLVGSVRAAVGCANAVPEHAIILNAIVGTNNTAELIDTLPSIVNKRGLTWSGKNVSARLQRLGLMAASPKAIGHGIKVGAIVKEPITLAALNLNGFSTGAWLNAEYINVDSLRIGGCASPCVGENAIKAGGATKKHFLNHVVAQDFQFLYNKVDGKVDSLSLVNSDMENVGGLSPMLKSMTNSNLSNLNWNNFTQVILARSIQNVSIQNDTFSVSNCKESAKVIDVEQSSQVTFTSNQVRVGVCNKIPTGQHIVSFGNAQHVTVRNNDLEVAANAVVLRIGTDSLMTDSVWVETNSIRGNGIGLLASGKHLTVNRNTISTRYHAVLTDQLVDSKLWQNTLVATDSSVARLENSQRVIMSQNTLYGDTNTKIAARKVIHLNIGNPNLEANRGKNAPIIINDGVEKINGKSRRILYGSAKPKDVIELFFSDSARANARVYLADTVEVDADGNWKYVMPREWSKEHHKAFFLTATATDTNANTSELSNVYRVDTLLRLVYVLNTNNAGANSLRWAIDQVNATDFYTKVIFKIPGAGPHIIQPDSLLPNIYNYSGFVIDGKSQLDSAQKDLKDPLTQLIVVDGTKIDSGYAFNILPEVGNDSRVNNISIANFGNGIQLQSTTVLLDTISVQARAGVRGDTAFHVVIPTGSKYGAAISASKVSGFANGIVLDAGMEKANLIGNRFDSVGTGILVPNGSKECRIVNNVFLNVDTVAIKLTSAGLENLIRENWFGYDPKTNVVATKLNVGVWLENTSGAIMDSNKVVVVSSDTSQEANGVGILLTGTSKSNNIFGNHVGWHPKATALPTEVIHNGTGIFLQAATLGDIADNKIYGNVLGQLVNGLVLENTKDNFVVGNYIGGTKKDSSLHAIDSTGIVVVNSLRDQFTDNHISSYKVTAIDLQNSVNVTLSKNVGYSKSDTLKAINLHETSNKGVKAPSVTSWDVVDTSTIIIRGKAQYPNGTIEVFAGREGYMQSSMYIDRVDFNSADSTWSLVVKKPYFTFDKKQYYVATYTDAEGNTSEFGSSLKASGLLCKIDTLQLPPYIETCPGIVTELDAGIKGLTYKWEAMNNSPITGDVTSQQIKVKRADFYKVTVSDDFGCVKSKTVEIRLKGRAVEPDFIVSGSVYTNDTVTIIDISEPRPDSLRWDFGGAKFLKLLTKDRYQYVVFTDSGSYTITQYSVMGECESVLKKEVLAVPRGTVKPKEKPVVLPEAVRITDAILYPNPVTDGYFVVKATISERSATQIFISRGSDGVDIYRYDYTEEELETVDGVLELKTSHYVSTLPNGLYVLRIVAGQDSKTIKFTVVR